MAKHFCTCPVSECPYHPNNQDGGCDLCIKKNLELGEIPACFWENVSHVAGTTKYSAENFARFVLEKREEGA